MSVADFYRKIMRTLGELDIEVRIWPMPVEIPNPVLPFPENEEQAAYDPEAVGCFWRALLQVHRVFTDFRARYFNLWFAWSFSRPRVSDDNPYSESLFQTLKYRPEYPGKPFSCIEEAQHWVSRQRENVTKTAASMGLTRQLP